MKLLVLMLVCAIAVTFAIAVNLHSPSTSADDGWIPLLNGKNFDGWYSFTETGGKNNDPTHVFKLEDGAVHILDVAPGAKFENGYLSTVKDYSNVRIHVEYKWGTKRFAPRANTRRDAGILYHVVGKDGVWPRSIECQIQENDFGDIVPLGGISSVVNGKPRQEE